MPDPTTMTEDERREYRMTTGDPYFGRTEAELDAMYEDELAIRRGYEEAAGVCEEFPNGEFAVPGFNC